MTTRSPTTRVIMFGIKMENKNVNWEGGSGSVSTQSNIKPRSILDKIILLHKTGYQDPTNVIQYTVYTHTRSESDIIIAIQCHTAVLGIECLQRAWRTDIFTWNPTPLSGLIWLSKHCSWSVILCKLSWPPQQTPDSRPAGQPGLTWSRVSLKSEHNNSDHWLTDWPPVLI